MKSSKLNFNAQNRPPVEFVTVYTDASFCSNSRVGGWGVYLITNQGRSSFSGRFYGELVTAEQAEFQAACNGLHNVDRSLFGQYGTGCPEIVIVLVTDCQAVMTTLNSIIYTGSAKKSNQATKWFTQYLHSLPPNVKIRIKKVKAHSNNDGARSWVNSRVDELAYNAMVKQRSRNWRKMRKGK